MVKRIAEIKKNTITRKRKRIILIGTEGRNKTEQLYFRELERAQNKYHIIFSSGNETDPVGIVRKTINNKKKQDLMKGDLAFCVFDLDADSTKESCFKCAKTMAETAKITIISSNPCFEIWYLEHFGYSNRPYSNSRKVIEELQKHVPQYMKSRCDFERYYPLTHNAVINCQKLDKHHLNYGYLATVEFSNPRTDVYKIVQILLENIENSFDKNNSVIG